MRLESVCSRIGKVVLAGTLAATLACPAPTLAFAATSKELEQQADALRDERVALEQKVQEAQEQLAQLYQQAEQCENDLITVENQLAETEDRIDDVDLQIAETRSELKRTQENLSGIIAESYKTGKPNIITMVLSADSFDELLSRITYANKVSEYESQAIQAVRVLEAQLGQQRLELDNLKATQEQLVVEQEQKLAAAEEAAAAVESYKSQLSAEITTKIAEEEQKRQEAAAEAAREAAEEARRKAEEEARRQAEAEARRQLAIENGYTYYESSSSYAGDVNSFVASAYSIIGAGYSWTGYNWTGDVSSSWFTCSGVIDYALGRAPRSSSPETLYAEVGSRLVYSTSQLNYGDLVFYSYAGRYPGHVGIYVGNGQIIDAIPGGVAVRNVGYMPFIGGGPII